MVLFALFGARYSLITHMKVINSNLSLELFIVSQLFPHTDLVHKKLDELFNATFWECESLSARVSETSHRTISKAVWIKVPWGRNSGWSGHLILSTGAVAGLLQMTPTDNSLYYCDLQTPPYTSGSATTTRRLLKETCVQATFIDHHIHVKML